MLRRPLHLLCVFAVLASTGCAGSSSVSAPIKTAATGLCNPPASGAFSVRNDGVTDNTVALQAVFDGCGAAGGGTVTLAGGGVILTGPIQLRSNTTLFIDANTTLRAVSDMTRQTWAFIGNPYVPNEALVSAANATNVGIAGTGTIDGMGGLWWPAAFAAKNAVTAGATSYPGYPGVPTTNGLPRPWLVEFYNCTNVNVANITLTNSPMWDLAIRYSNNVTVNGLIVKNPSSDDPAVSAAAASQNTDGVDVVSSNNVTLTNLFINTNDDNVAIKSGFPGFPAVPQVAVTNVTVTNSTFLYGHGLSIGSEAVNGVQHMRADNITFIGTQNGPRLKTGRDRGSSFSDMVFSNITETNVKTPFSFSAYYPSILAPSDQAAPITALTPFVNGISIINLKATGAGTGGQLVGLPESPMLNVTLTNININSTGTGMQLRNVSGTFNGVAIAPAKGTQFVNEGAVSIQGQPINM